jgi:hypothetical protein
MINEDNLSENIRKIALFAFSQKSKVRNFTDLEYEFEIPKKEIISIFNLFSKANIFFYELISIPEEDKNYDLFPSRKRIEAKTGAFMLYFTPEKSRLIKLNKQLYTPTGSNIPNGILNKDVAREIVKMESKMHKFLKSKEFKKREGFIKKYLEDLINSSKKREIFIKKYAKYIKLPITQNDKNIKVGKLSIDLDSGNYKYYNKKGCFNIKSQEYRVLYRLIKNRNYQSNYDELSKSVNRSEVKSERDGLYTIIRNIKRELGILPKSKRSKKDIFKNIKGFGYGLLTNN